MHTLLLIVHSLVRWVILAAGLTALVHSIRGWTGRHAWTATHQRVGLIFTAAMDVQLVLGLVMYFGTSPLVQFNDMRATMKNSELRFWTVEHITLMLLALVIVHVTRVRARKASDDLAKHRRTAIGFGIAIVCMLAAIPWPFLSHARPWIRFG